jgi:DNA-binding NarL/FixJ family response regulator
MPVKILIVDDHQVTRKTVRALLGEHFINVCGEAKNGKDAIAKVKKLRPEIVLLDINIPVMNGLQAAYEIHNVAPLTKIIFFTVYDGPEQKAAARLLGIHAFVVKSSAGTQLVPAVKRLIASD